MKNFISIILALISISVQSQTRRSGSLIIAADSTAVFSQDASIGTFVFDNETNQFYKITDYTPMGTVFYTASREKITAPPSNSTSNIYNADGTVSDQVRKVDLNNNSIVFSGGDGSIGIGEESPDSSAILNISSTEKGVLMPRLTNAQINAIVSPKESLLVYNKEDSLYNFFDGLNWNSLEGALPRNYKFVAGVLRNTGSGWYAINDIDHQSLNIDSVTNNASSISVHHSLGAVSIATLVVSPDETYAGSYEFGASVGLDVSTINIKHRVQTKVTGLITHTGGGVFVDNSGTITSTPYNSTTGELTINHTACAGVNPVFWDLPNGDVNQTQFQTSTFSASTTSTKVKLYNKDGTQKSLANPEVSRFYFSKDIDPINLKTIGVNPNFLIEPTGNIWVMGIFKIY